MKIRFRVRYWRPRVIVWVAGVAPGLVEVGSPCNARLRHRDVGKLLEDPEGNATFYSPRNLVGNFGINDCRKRVCDFDLIDQRIRQPGEFFPGFSDEKNQRRSSGVNFEIEVVSRLRHCWVKRKIQRMSRRIRVHYTLSRCF